MTTLQSHSLTAIITATIAVAVTYAILTNGDTQPPPIDPETYRTEERMRMRDSIVQPELVRDSLEAVKERIWDRPRQRFEVDSKHYEDAIKMYKEVIESGKGLDSLLIERIENWER